MKKIHELKGTICETDQYYLFYADYLSPLNYLAEHMFLKNEKLTFYYCLDKLVKSTSKNNYFFYPTQIPAKYCFNDSDRDSYETHIIEKKEELSERCYIS